MYPHTTRFIRILAADNAGLDTTANLKGMDDWIWPDNIELIEHQLKGLTVKEMGAIAKEDGAIDVYRRHAIPDVKEFVDEFFDGALWRNFYNPTPVTADYPRLSEIVRMLASDNGGDLKPRRSWVWPNNAPRLEQMAQQLTNEELATLVIGEHDEQRALVIKRDLSDLDQFVNDIFDDGPLVRNFFKD